MKSTAISLEPYGETYKYVEILHDHRGPGLVPVDTADFVDRTPYDFFDCICAEKTSRRAVFTYKTGKPTMGVYRIFLKDTWHLRVIVYWRVGNLLHGVSKAVTPHIAAYFPPPRINNSHTT